MQRTGGGYQGVFQQPFTPQGYQPHLSIDLAPGTIYTLNVPPGALNVMLQCVTQNVYYTLDGSDPTATHGFVIFTNNAPIFIELTNNVTLRFLESAAGAYLQAQFGE